MPKVPSYSTRPSYTRALRTLCTLMPFVPYIPRVHQVPYMYPTCPRVLRALLPYRLWISYVAVLFIRSLHTLHKPRMLRALSVLEDLFTLNKFTLRFLVRSLKKRRNEEALEKLNLLHLSITIFFTLCLWNNVFFGHIL